MQMSLSNIHTKLVYNALALFTCTLLAACGGKYSDASSQRRKDEKVAAELLEQARTQMRQGQLDEAKKTIKVMRDSCRYALDGREEGIILLDSIELLKAQSDTTVDDQEMRVQFYQRKLEHDRKSMQQH